MNRKINKFGMGGVAEAALYLVPVYGTYKSIKDAVNNPTWQNIGMAGLSAASDVGTLFGVGALGKGAVAAAKGLNAANKAMKVARASRPALATKAMNAEVAAQRATNAYNKASRMAVPVNRWAEGQTYLKALGQQKQKATQLAIDAKNQLNKADFLSRNRVMPKVNFGSPALHAFNIGFKPAVVSTTNLNK